MTYAKVIADSVSERGDRLTTMEVRLHRFVLAEFNTHRMFSRNSASSRAIPFHRQVERVMEYPAVPVSWPAEQKGMQGGEELDSTQRRRAQVAWIAAKAEAVDKAKELHKLGVHKSVVNRLLEPFMWHTVIVSSTEWDNFWRQRCSPLAQPEIRVAAEAMKEAYDKSVPNVATKGGWHLPYIDDEDTEFLAYSVGVDGPEMLEICKKVSVARCARVSYLTHDGRRDLEDDCKLYNRLVMADPPHASPLEHVATPCTATGIDAFGCCPGNFRGWHQLRHMVVDC